jgi:hypothetical protein
VLCDAAMTHPQPLVFPEIKLLRITCPDAVPVRLNALADALLLLHDASQSSTQVTEAPMAIAIAEALDADVFAILHLRM